MTKLFTFLFAMGLGACWLPQSASADSLSAISPAGNSMGTSYATQTLTTYPGGQGPGKTLSPGKKGVADDSVRTTGKTGVPDDSVRKDPTLNNTGPGSGPPNPNPLYDPRNKPY